MNIHNHFKIKLLFFKLLKIDFKKQIININPLVLYYFEKTIKLRNDVE
jgi:hypothetical protein